MGDRAGRDVGARRGGGSLRRGRRRGRGNAARSGRTRPLSLFLFRRNLFFPFFFPSRPNPPPRPVPRFVPRGRRRGRPGSHRPARRARAREIREIPREARDVGGLLAESPDAGDVRGDAGRSDAPLAGGRLFRRSGLRGFGALGPDVSRLGHAARDAGLLGPPRAPRHPRAPRSAARGLGVLARAQARGSRRVARLPRRDHGELPARSGRGCAAPRGPRRLPRSLDVPARAAHPPLFFARGAREAIRAARMSDRNELFAPKLGLTLPLCSFHFIFFFLSKMNPEQTYGLFAFDPRAALERPWTFVTYQFLHGEPFGLFFGTLILYILGSALEAEWGTAEFTVFWLVSTLGASLAALVTGNGLVSGGVVTGASMLFAYAYLFPDMQFLIFFVVPVKVKWIAWLGAAGSGFRGRGRRRGGVPLFLDPAPRQVPGEKGGEVRGRRGEIGGRAARGPGARAPQPRAVPESRRPAPGDAGRRGPAAAPARVRGGAREARRPRREHLQARRLQGGQGRHLREVRRLRRMLAPLRGGAADGDRREDAGVERDRICLL